MANKIDVDHAVRTITLDAITAVTYDFSKGVSYDGYQTHPGGAKPAELRGGYTALELVNFGADPVYICFHRDIEATATNNDGMLRIGPGATYKENTLTISWISMIAGAGTPTVMMILSKGFGAST